MIPQYVQAVREAIDFFDVDVEEVWKTEVDLARPVGGRFDLTLRRYWRFEIFTPDHQRFEVDVPDKLVRQHPRTAAAMVRRSTVHVVLDDRDPRSA